MGRKRRFRSHVKVRDAYGNIVKHIKRRDAIDMVDGGSAEDVSWGEHGQLQAIQVIEKNQESKTVNASISARESERNALCYGRHLDTLSPLEEFASEKVRVWREIHDTKAPLLIRRLGGGT